LQLFFSAPAVIGAVFFAIWLNRFRKTISQMNEQALLRSFRIWLACY